jgi:hypothetical protein
MHPARKSTTQPHPHAVFRDIAADPMFAHIATLPDTATAASDASCTGGTLEEGFPWGRVRRLPKKG